MCGRRHVVLQAYDYANLKHKEKCKAVWIDRFSSWWNQSSLKCLASTNVLEDPPTNGDLDEMDLRCTDFEVSVKYEREINSAQQNNGMVKVTYRWTSMLPSELFPERLLVPARFCSFHKNCLHPRLAAQAFIPA